MEVPHDRGRKGGFESNFRAVERSTPLTNSESLFFPERHPLYRSISVSVLIGGTED